MAHRVWNRTLGRGPGWGRPTDGCAAGEKLTRARSTLCSESLVEWDFWLSFTGYCSFPIILLCKFLGVSAESGGKLSSHCEV